MKSNKNSEGGIKKGWRIQGLKQKVPSVRLRNEMHSLSAVTNQQCTLRTEMARLSDMALGIRAGVAAGKASCLRSPKSFIFIIFGISYLSTFISVTCAEALTDLSGLLYTEENVSKCYVIMAL